ncbi:MAG: hypothetical protein QCI00_07620 [Candidatus Thermoplasmatota archaeon]|nr:hypothetical protein [Candidatus Thermoplasmatota archaeon]
MSNIKHIFMIFLIVTGFLLLNVEVHTSSGITVMPGAINLGDVVKGTYYTRQITIINSGEEPIGIALSSEGLLASYITFSQDSDFSYTFDYLNVSKKENVLVRFFIPLTFPSGFFNTTIYVKTADFFDKDNNNTQTSSIYLSFPICVTLNATGEVNLSGEITYLEIKDNEVGYPILFHIGFLNKGNVIAFPAIYINISRGSWYIDNLKHSQTWIDSGRGEIIAIEWDTENREPGAYDARVTIVLDENIIEDQNLSFQILPRGSLTRNGELQNLSFSGNLQVGNTIKIIASFKNTGGIETTAKLIGEVYIDDNLVDSIESDGYLVKTGRASELISYYKLVELGQYTINGYVLYEGNQTSIKTISFQMGDELFGNVLNTILLFIVVIIIFSFILYFYRRKKSDSVD